MKNIYLLISTIALTIFSVGQLFSQTITVTGALNTFEKCPGLASSSQSFDVSGESLTANINIGTFTGLEYSTDNTTFLASLVLSHTGGIVNVTTIYVRMTAAENATIFGLIFIFSAGAATQTVVVTGVMDGSPPVANVNNLANVTDECEVTALTAPTATDVCAGSITGTHTITLPITAQGTTVVIWTYDDGNGNTSTQNQNVIIDDNNIIPEKKK